MIQNVLMVLGFYNKVPDDVNNNVSNLKCCVYLRNLAVVQHKEVIFTIYFSPKVVVTETCNSETSVCF
jgi:hypothetical protein